MQKLLAELKRRQMFRVAAAYAVVAWIILQVVNNLAPGLNLPNWAVTLVIVLLGAGLPVALLFRWIQQLAPADGAQAQAKVNKLDWILAGGLAAVIALILYQQLAPSGSPVAQDKAGTESPAQALAPTGISIAVLPFANVSGDASREFFSDGMTDEISGALAKVRDLRVIARTSAFQFKGQSQDVRDVGQALGASHLIEGSVRQAGNRVRITAQLVRAGDGVQLWSENYDRELTDIFTIQEDIAQAIAGALRVPLGLAQGQTLVSNRTADLETYQEYLRARALFRGRDLDQTIMVLDRIIARDPTHAPAWALLSVAQRLTANRQPAFLSGSIEQRRQLVEVARDKAERAAGEALRLDPKYPGALAAQAPVEAAKGRWAVAEALYRQALAIDPSDPDILDGFSQGLRFVGRLRESLELRERLRTLEPFVPIYNIQTGATLVAMGQNQAAIAILETTPPDIADDVGNRLRAIGIARAYAELGRYGEAADALLAMRSTAYSRRSIEEAARLLRSAPTPPRTLSTLPALEPQLEFVYLHVGAPERVLDNYERMLEGGITGFLPPYWSPAFAPVRKSERFRVYLRRNGTIDMWRASAWPDLCRPVGADDFECD
jgi:TolB-like protein